MTGRPDITFLDQARNEGELKTSFFGLMLDNMAEAPGRGARSELTISAGAVTPPAKAARDFAIDTEADAANDDLDHIDQANTEDGCYIVIGNDTAGRTVKVVHGAGGSGQILLRDSADVILGDPLRRIWLFRNGASWEEIWRNFEALPLAAAPGEIANNAIDGQHDIDIAGGIWRAEDAADNIALAATTISMITAGNGGRLDGETLDPDTWYHVLSGRDTASGDFVAGFKKTIARPTGWDYFRRHGSVLTDVSSNNLAFSQLGDEFLWKDPPNTNNLSLGTTASLETVVTPSNVRSVAILNVFGSHSTSGRAIYVSSPDVNDEPPAVNSAPGTTIRTDGAGRGTPNYVHIRTSLLSQVRARADGGSTVLRLVTLGWIDSRGRA